MAYFMDAIHEHETVTVSKLVYSRSKYIHDYLHHIIVYLLRKIILQDELKIILNLKLIQFRFIYIKLNPNKNLLQDFNP